MMLSLGDSTIWWLLAGIAIAVELITGTFYLLMVAIGLAAGAIAAHMGAPLPAQLIAAAVVGGGAVAAWHLQRRKRPPEPVASENRDVNLDIGESVHIDHWNADGTTSIKYRGANWAVVAASGADHATGAHRVCEVIGNRLVVEKI